VSNKNSRTNQIKRIEFLINKGFTFEETGAKGEELGIIGTT